MHKAEAEETHDGRLLRLYLERGDQTAFARLAERYLGLVYSACLRETGSPSQAEDAAQAVFLLLARKAPSLTARASLAGWLFAAARLVSRNARRQEKRRQRQEQQAMEETTRSERDAQADAAAWAEVAPALNDALAALSGREREAVLLRFFQGLSLAETGGALGVSADAAQMRVSRALDKLRRHLAKAGVTVSGAALVTLLPSHAARSLPAGGAGGLIAAFFPSTPGAAGANAYGLYQGAVKAMWMTNVKIAALIVSVGLLGAYGGLTAHRAFSAARPRPAAVVRPVAATGGTVQAQASPVVASPLRRQLAQLQLQDGFTLTYKEVRRDVSTQEMRDGDHVQNQRSFEEQRRGWEDMVRKGQMTRHEADGKIETLRLIGAAQQKQDLPQESRITLSAHDGRLLLWTQGFIVSTDRPPMRQSFAYVYDGRNTFVYSGSGQEAAIRPGWQLWMAFPCPLPGVGMPLVPIIRTPAAEAAPSADVLIVSGEIPDDLPDMATARKSAGVSFSPGELRAVTQNGRVMVRSLTMGAKGQPQSRWDFTEHKLFQGLWIASQMRWTLLDAGQPALICDYTLQGAAAKPLGVKQFDGTYWLKAGTPVKIYGPHEVISFAYNPRGGGLEEQGKHAPAGARSPLP